MFLFPNKFAEASENLKSYSELKNSEPFKSVSSDAYFFDLYV